jgi:hypothetical protein
MIKYADHLKNVTAKEFCEGVGLKADESPNDFGKNH